jgi:uncharacterized protein YkwD
MGNGSPRRHSIRTLSAALLACAAAAVVGAARAEAPASPRTAGAVAAAASAPLTAAESAVLAEVNQARVEHGRAPLDVDPRLVRAARAHTASIVESGTFEHGRFWVWIQRAGVSAGRLGETLGWSSPASGSESRIVARWLASPEHRAIVLDPTFDDVGVGARIGPFLGRRDALVVTADFHGHS